MFMASQFFQDIRINLSDIIAQGIGNYEKEFGKFKIDIVKRNFFDTSVELLSAIIDRIENNDEISIIPLKNILLKVTLEINFDVIVLKNITSYIKDSIINFIKTRPSYSFDSIRIIDNYYILVQENIENYNFYSSSSALDILQEQPEYQYSDLLYSVIPLEIDQDQQKIYTLFPSSRYWEKYKTLTGDFAYSPIPYNRIASKVGLSKYRISLSYESLILYEEKLYKLKPGISQPTYSYFEVDEWVEYTSKRLDLSKSFKTVYESKLRSAFSKITETGFDVNSIISDSDIIQYSKEAPVDEKLLSSTFGGIGKQVLDSIKSLRVISEAFGGYEGSPVGGIEYIANFSEYLLSAGLGRKLPEVYEISDGISIFGKFDFLFKSQMSVNKIPGLKFLSSFGSLKSFTQNQTFFSDKLFTNLNKVIYNPVYSQFFNGIRDRYKLLTEPTTYYFEENKIDLLSFAIEGLYKKSLAIGDTIQAVFNTLDSSGKVIGYEGLGSVKVQVDEFQRIFPPSIFILNTPRDSKINVGFTGAIKYLLDNYSRFSNALIDPLLPGKSLEFFRSWIELISNKLEEVNSLLKSIGITTSAFIPNLSFKSFEADNSRVISYLTSLGFRDYEINKLLEVKSFKELVTNFAPLSNSSDLKSFFRGYELTQLIYEFGGQEGIDEYLSFLYSNNPLDSLLNILSLSQKEKSKITNINISRYPKLIGLLIGLTYAIDPNQIVKFNEILGKNNLTLLESISYLYQNGETTIIKNKEDINLLKPLVEQMITGVYKDDAFSSPTLNYDQVNSTSPIALKQWTKILGDNLGKIDSKSIIENLYDKAQGLTPKELITILNNPDPSNSFGNLIDGFSGGTFTNFLKYASISGIAIKLGFYKNSYQTDNFKVVENPEFYALPKLVENLEDMINFISIVKTIFSSRLNYTVNTDPEFSDSLQPLIYSQNKSFEVIPQLISARAGESGTPNQATLATTSNIVESPGIGNSRLPNRVPALNSITPEQSRALFESIPNVSVLTSSENFYSSIISKYIKFTNENTLANNIILIDETTEASGSIDETTEASGSEPKQKKFIPATKYELISIENTPQSKPYTISDIYKYQEGSPNLKSSTLGSNYISNEQNLDLYPSMMESFDPIESCKKFGGTNCEQIYSSSQERCGGPFNKSLFPETYSKVPGLTPSSVPIDRPLGTFADYKPSENLIPTSSFNTPPAYTGLLPDDTLIGKNGEPILKNIFSEPFVFEYGTSQTSEYGNTEFAIIEFIKAKLEKNTEFNCASLDSPFYYQVCMNVVKCKRFSPPLNGKFFLNFCPKSLSGGKLK